MGCQSSASDYAAGLEILRRGYAQASRAFSIPYASMATFLRQFSLPHERIRMLVRPRFAVKHNAIASLAKELHELRQLVKDRRAASLRRGNKRAASNVPPTATPLSLRTS